MVTGQTLMLQLCKLISFLERWSREATDIEFKSISLSLYIQSQILSQSKIDSSVCINRYPGAEMTQWPRPKKLRQRHRNCSCLAFGVTQWDVTYMNLRKILSLPKEPTLLLETQISKAVDVSTNVVLLSAASWLGHILLWGTEIIIRIGSEVVRAFILYLILVTITWWGNIIIPCCKETQCNDMLHVRASMRFALYFSQKHPVDKMRVFYHPIFWPSASSYRPLVYNKKKRKKNKKDNLE